MFSFYSEISFIYLLAVFSCFTTDNDNNNLINANNLTMPPWTYTPQELTTTQHASDHHPTHQLHTSTTFVFAMDKFPVILFSRGSKQK